jgi:hypothetical protein
MKRPRPVRPTIDAGLAYCERIAPNATIDWRRPHM